MNYHITLDPNQRIAAGIVAEALRSAEQAGTKRRKRDLNSPIKVELAPGLIPLAVLLLDAITAAKTIPVISFDQSDLHILFSALDEEIYSANRDRQFPWIGITPDEWCEKIAELEALQEKVRQALIAADPPAANFTLAQVHEIQAAVPA